VVLVFAAAVPAAVRAQGGAEGGGGLYDINTGLSFWTLVVFGILVFLLGKFAWGPILGAVQAREQGIQAALDEAAARNQEAARLLAEHKEQLADARRQASELIAEGKASGEEVRAEIEGKAREEAQAIIDRARVEIERERDAAIQLLRKASGEEVRAEIEGKAREEAQAIIDRARVEIERERDAAIQVLRKESVNLALAAASRLLNENLDQEKDRHLVERYIDEIGAMGSRDGARA